MRSFILSHRGKSLVTTLLLVGLVLSHTKSDLGAMGSGLWQSAHSIVCALWFLFTGLHVYQHWALIKAMTKKRVLLRNKVTALTTALFVMMGISILLLTLGVNHFTLKFHHVIGHLYVLVLLIHTFTKLRGHLSKRQRQRKCREKAA